jgi:hypothetical protein
MGIDRWKQEHRNWRPSGVTLVASDTEPDKPPPSAVPNEKTPTAKPRAAKQQAGSSSGSVDRSTDKLKSQRSKR